MTKKILITGKNSYIGNQLAAWLNKEPEKYEVIKECVRDDKWKEIDFSIYEVVVHVAGVAHIEETTANKKIYYEVNRDLSYEIAKKAKKYGVKLFVFLSTMSVYGKTEGIVNKNTVADPTTNYGKSKLEAEQLILSLSGNNFKIAILRPPMIYGKGCKGNYNRLKKVALNTPIFPMIDNKRSMIYIENLNEFIKMVIDNMIFGVFHPQNQEYMSTTMLVKTIAEENNKKIFFTKIFNPFIYIGIKYSKTVSKVFGTLIYDQAIIDKDLIITKDINNKDSIKATER
ncbi:UDP-glucose 4-epimerase (galactowaldenases) [Carnobacterium sp. AT7]|uniref:NAD-dependent epimerase/dehydratase family protein n=1 Tax=Carnobacterium sp. AT7 TaxID=333990 RepID=UPI00015F1787|nr:NAD-dependent epimerase/dehydratase family protein [Carnobacterium sp. AT7]EDP68094.1 UDP-glucose 4-epimerase (galactowaldenases) [Carnobacterium sp. AT7]